MIVNERDQVKRESDAVLLKYKQLRVDFSDVKEVSQKNSYFCKGLEVARLFMLTMSICKTD